MPKNWWQKWVSRPNRSAGGTRRTARRRTYLCLERLEEIVTPTITLGPVSLTPAGPINEGQSATLNGSYTATNVIGTLQLAITASAPIQFTAPSVLPSGSGT